MIVDDTLYHRGVDTVLRRCLMHDEAEKVLNDYHSVRSCHACHIFDRKTRLPLAPLHPVVFVGPFAKWAIDFMTCNPTSAGGNGYIIVTINYFTKWVEDFVEKCDQIYTLSIGVWSGSGLTIQCEISSLKLTIDLLPETSEEEARFLELIHLDETHRDTALANKTHKKRIRVQFHKNVKSRVFSEGDLVLLYDQVSDKLGAGKFEPLRMDPYIVKQVLAKVAYELVDYNGIPLSQPRNGLYLKRYYA
eukprot:PITA_28448